MERHLLRSPQKFEAGTPNVAGAVGLGKAIEYIRQFSMDEIAIHEHKLYEIAKQGLSEIKGFREYGAQDKAAVLSFTFEGLHPHDLASLMHKV